MEDEILEDIKSTIEEALENALEEQIENLSDSIQERLEESVNDVISEFFEEGIEDYLENHQFMLPDGTIVQSRQKTKVLSPDGKSLLICYGGLRVDGKTLIVQERISSWSPLYSFASEEEAIAALKKVKDAIEQGISIIEL